MITLSNGHFFEYMAASGSLGFDGRGWPWERPLKYMGLLDTKLFTTVAKTITLKPRKGNLEWHAPWRSVRYLPVFDSVVNAVGLTNPGLDYWCEHIGPYISSPISPLMASVYGTPAEVGEMARRLGQFGLVGLEINASCPNTGRLNLDTIVKCCEAAKANTNLPLILKTAYSDDLYTAKEYGLKDLVKGVSGIIEAFSINSVPWKTVFGNLLESPLKMGGAISGRQAQPFNRILMGALVSLTNIPVIAPSIWDYEDIEGARAKGAKAISFGSVFLRYPWRPTLYIRRDKKCR